ncbi:MAG: methionyl-tRNA formyltransferase [Ruminococcus sp.]|jgi:methionyl-tRNA formyltransferase
MRVVFMGTPDFSVGTLKALAEAGYDIAAVVTQPDKPRGRGKAMQPTPVKEAALSLGLPVLQPEKVREESFLNQVESLKPDVIVVVAFGQIIPGRLLKIPPLGCINVHASLLPDYRGAAPIQWAVIDGKKESGVTIMRMDEGLDTGDMISRTVVPLDSDETGGSLFEKLSQAGARLLVDTLPSLENKTAVFEKQPEISPTPYASMITKKMGDIQWDKPAVQLERLIRGLNPWPSAYTRVARKNLKLWKAAVVSENSGKLPGQVVKISKDGIFVQTGDGILCVLELQLEGKKRMSAEAFLRGYKIEEGTILGG